MAISKITTGSISDSVAIDTDTLVVDGTNNRVGVGTSSPEAKLHISTGGGIVPFASSQIVSESAGNNYIELNGGSTSTTAVYFGDSSDQDAGGVLYNHSNDSLSFRANAASRMLINNSGHVTMPYQPAFFASGGGGSFNSSGIFLGDSNAAQKTNVGGHYSYSTGRFTAPVAGVYMFSYLLTTNDTAAHMVNIHINGVDNLQPVLNYYNQYDSATNVVIFTLAANDYVEAHLRAATGYGYYGARFCGHLIG